MGAIDEATEDSLRDIYFDFCSFGCGERQQVDMEGKALIKLAKDCKLLGKNVTTTDIDLIFAKVKTKGQRKIGFDQFLLALDEIASKKGCSLNDIAAAVLAANGPVDGGTKAEAVRLHDDKTTYTGVYAKGGPSNVDMDPANLASVCDRSAANVRGIKTNGSSPAGSRRGTGDLISAARRSTNEAVTVRRSTSEAPAAAGAGAGARRSTKEDRPASRIIADGVKNLKI